MKDFDRVIAEALFNATKENQTRETKTSVSFMAEHLISEHYVIAISKELLAIGKDGAAIGSVATRICRELGVQWLYNWALAQCDKSVLAKKDFEKLSRTCLMRTLYNGHFNKHIPVKDVDKATFINAILHETRELGRNSQLKKLTGPKIIDKILDSMNRAEPKINRIVRAAVTKIVESETNRFDFNSTTGRITLVDTGSERSPMFHKAPISFGEIENSLVHINKISGTMVEAGLKRIINMAFTLDVDYNNALSTLINDDLFKTFMLKENAIEAGAMASGNAIKLGFKHAIADWDHVGNGQFYMGLKVDSRGRVYQRGAMSSISHKALKAGLRAGRKHRLGVDGYTWLKRGIAGLMGFDNLTWNERDQWFDDNESELVEIGRMLIESPLDGWGMLLAFGSDDIYGSASALIELSKIVNYDGNMEDYESNLMVAFDGTSSGCQIISLSLHARDIATQCNVCHIEGEEEGKRDAYMLIVTEMVKTIEELKAGKIEKESLTGEKYSECLGVWEEKFADDKGLQRNIAKKTLMKAMYGGKALTHCASCRQLIQEKGITWSNENVSSSVMGAWLGNLFTYCWNKEGSRLSPLKEWETFSREMGKAFNDVDKHASWEYETPGFNTMTYEARYYKQRKTAITSVVDGQKRYGNAYGMDMERLLEPFTSAKKKVEKDKAKVLTATAPHMIHTMDSLILIGAVLNMEDESMLLTHDSLGCVIGKAGKMLDAINQTIVGLFGNGGRVQVEKLINHCKLETGVEVKLPSGCLEPQIEKAEIKRARYSFC